MQLRKSFYSGILKFPLVDTDGFVIKIVDVSGGEERVFEWGPASREF
ncbi:MAG: hypothetical protein WC873_03070 [Candidatus Gracilibacteria bacterium]